MSGRASAVAMGDPWYLAFAWRLRNHEMRTKRSGRPPRTPATRPRTWHAPRRPPQRATTDVHGEVTTSTPCCSQPRDGVTDVSIRPSTRDDLLHE